jgi:hypothetical protein
LDERAETATSHENHQHQPFDDLRGQMEERVATYLMSVVKTHGIQTLESDRESLDHAAQVARIIRDTITEKGHTLQDLRLNDERIATISGKLVGELPYALAASRNRELGQDFSLDQPTRLAPEQLTREHAVRDQQLNASELERGYDEIVEQKVSRAVGQITEQSNNHNSGHPSLNGHHQQPHSTVSDLAINNKEQALGEHIPVWK